MKFIPFSKERLHLGSEKSGSGLVYYLPGVVFFPLRIPRSNSWSSFL